MDLGSLGGKISDLIGKNGGDNLENTLKGGLENIMGASGNDSTTNSAVQEVLSKVTSQFGGTLSSVSDEQVNEVIDKVMTKLKIDDSQRVKIQEAVNQALATLRGSLNQ